MSAMVEIRAPAEQTEGTRSQLLRWLKGIGDAVVENEPLIEVETDKVTVEIPAPASGVLREIVKREDEEISPGELLGRMEVAEAPREAAPGDTQPMPRLTLDASSPDAGARPPLSPAVRRLLAEHGLDPSGVQGTGAGGRVTAEDVMRHVAAMQAKQGVADAMDSGIARTGGAVDLSSSAERDAAQTGIRRVPHSATRRQIAQRMVESLLHTAPHVTTVFEADLSRVLAHRERHREALAKEGAPLTLTAYFVAACVDAIREVPEANARWTDDALEIFENVNIGVATALADGGLVVPVLKNVERRDLADIARTLHDLVSRARAGRLTPADVRGGTFTISNHGVSGSLVAAPIVIPQPQSAILGVGKLERRPVVIEESGEERIVVRPRCYVTLTLDHRVMDGHRANRFMQVFVERLESWS